ncbi:hypothetical protein [Streptomyces sp. ISL-11]|uniref:hypothetical protein n=1 Tax=Streptomyces sp. ISL-11 TaxID=2819174 RepID=UPI001BEAE110|nr:hypothetical protein [Streptomyces sp. ISL-11]MBT2385875.1 hypothetical protein [Streptomyces sp. ISL-11]
MSLRRALSALFVVGLALTAPAAAATDAGAVGPPPQAPRQCYTVEQARAELARQAAAPGRKSRQMVPVCQSTGATQCDPSGHTLYCQYMCQECDGLVCSQPYFVWSACGSC